MQSSTFCRANVEVHEVALLSVEPLYNLKQENCLNEKWFEADAARERHGLLWQGQTDIEQPRADYKGVTLMQDVVIMRNPFSFSIDILSDKVIIPPLRITKLAQTLASYILSIGLPALDSKAEYSLGIKNGFI